MSNTGMMELLVNLSNAAHWHASHCSEECSVSLSLLKELAEKVAYEYLGSEYDEAMVFIAKMPIGLTK